MMPRAEYAAGLLYGSFAAGPAFVTGMCLAEIGSASAAIPSHAGQCGLLMLLSIPFGAIIGCLPVMFGTGVLGWLGRYNVGLPPFWALTGAAMAGIPAWVSNGTEGVGATAAFAIAGALSALAARAGARWVDDGPPRPSRYYADR